MRKMLYIILGTASLLIALFIILTPFTPGSLFFLAHAALCFARVSPRADAWIRSLPWIGRYFKQLDENNEKDEDTA